MMFRNSMFFQFLITATFSFMSLIYCAQSWADVSISSRRISVDYEDSSTNFIVTSRQKTAQVCNLSLTHNSFDVVGNMSHYTGSELPPYAADNLVRYSPKRFELPANKKQTIRFTLRRRPNTPEMEHRSYVLLACSNKKSDQPLVIDPNSASFFISPQLVHSIPLIVRPQKLKVDVSFDNVKIDNDLLSFNLKRYGDRSVYGKVHVLNKYSNELISTSASVVMYIETTDKSFHMKLPISIQREQLVLKFKEDANFGGDLEVSWPEGLNL